MAVGSKEEGSGVPCILQSKAELHTVGLAGSDDGFQAVSILFGDDAGVIVHEVAVVGGHRVCVQGACNGCGSNRAGIIGLGDHLGNVTAGAGQSSSLHQTSHLVLREAVDVGSGSNVGNDLGAGVSLGNTLDGSIDDDTGVSSLESVDHFLSHSGNAVHLRNPHGDVVSTGQGILCFRIALSLSGSGIPGRSLGGLGGGRTAASSQAQNHNQSQQHCNDFFHFVFLLIN